MHTVHIFNDGQTRLYLVADNILNESMQQNNTIKGDDWIMKSDTTSDVQKEQMLTSNNLMGLMNNTELCTHH